MAPGCCFAPLTAAATLVVLCAPPADATIFGWDPPHADRGALALSGRPGSSDSTSTVPSPSGAITLAAAGMLMTFSRPRRPANTILHGR